MILAIFDVELSLSAIPSRQHHNNSALEVIMAVTRGADIIGKAPSKAALTEKTVDILSDDRVLDSLLRSKIDAQSSPISRITAPKTKIIYFNTVTDSNRDGHVNIQDVNSISPELRRWERINNLYVIISNQLSSNLEKDPTTYRLTEGEVILLPDTVKPQPSDYFAMKVFNRYNLFRVTEVNDVNLERDSSFQLTFKLEESNIDPDNFSLTSYITHTYNFEYRHVGTKYRSIFTIDDYQKLEDLRDFYNDLSHIYQENFYKQELNTYVLDYKGENLPVITAMTNTDSYVSPNSRNYKNKEFFDKEVIRFIKENEIFYNLDETIVPTTFTHRTDEDNYYNSIFNGVVNKNKDIQLKHHMPVKFSYGDPEYTPILYGKTFIIHIASLTDGAFSLYPPNFINTIQTLKSESKTHRQTTYNHVYEFLVEIIAHYINDFNAHIMDKLLYLKTLTNSLQAHKFQFREFMFYLYPIIAYIVQEQLERLSNKNFVRRLR